MKPKILLFAAIAILLPARRAPAKDAESPPINPALIYWQATASLPDLAGKEKMLLEDIINGKKPFDEAKAKDILSRGKESLKLFAKATASSIPCDWGLDKTEGPHLGFPHLSKMQELSRLAILKSESLCEEGKVTDGINWLLSVHRAARHAGVGDSFVAALTQNSIETWTMNAAAQRCMGWNDEMRTRYADGLKALPRLHSIQDAFGGEFYFIDWVERGVDFDVPKKSKEFDDLLQTKDKSDELFETIAGMIREQFSTKDAPKRFAEWRDLYHRTQEALGKPWKESNAELQALREEAERTNAIVAMTFPVFQEMGARGFEMATRRTMLDAILQYGPKLDEATAATFKDSFDGDPPILKRTEGGGLCLATGKQYKKGKDIHLNLGKQ